MINLFQNEISELDKMLTKETTEEGSQIKKADKKLRRLRINILKAEEEFSKLKVNFNNYLFENLSVNTGENELLK
jgi:Zn-finger nucleic acid-binding protein